MPRARQRLLAGGVSRFMEESLWPNAPQQKAFVWRVSGTVTLGGVMINS